jgi:ElaB/YqjD/DUF883 family membrane-anchored ribosome-binding protein
MSKHTQASHNDIGTLAEDPHSLMSATADVAGEKVGQARKRLAAALESGKEIYGRVQAKAVDCAKATDEALHDHPYHGMGIALGIGLGIGVLIGYFVLRRHSRNDTKASRGIVPDQSGAVSNC